MAINLGDYTFVRVVANEGAPPELMQFHGYTFSWPPDKPVPQGMDTLVINGVGLFGYARQINGEWQWVVQVQPDVNQKAIDLIPGPDGWTDLAARQVYYNSGLYLLQAGVTGDVLRPGLKNFYDAAIANYVADHS